MLPLSRSAHEGGQESELQLRTSAEMKIWFDGREQQTALSAEYRDLSDKYKRMLGDAMTGAGPDKIVLSPGLIYSEG